MPNMQNLARYDLLSPRGIRGRTIRYRVLRNIVVAKDLVSRQPEKGNIWRYPGYKVAMVKTPYIQPNHSPLMTRILHNPLIMILDHRSCETASGPLIRVPQHAPSVQRPADDLYAFQDSTAQHMA